MAMTGAGERAAIKAKLDTYVKPLFQNLADDENLTGLDYDTIQTAFARAIGEANVEYTTSNAEAIGTDSHGDTHDLNIV